MRHDRQPFSAAHETISDNSATRRSLAKQIYNSRRLRSSFLPQSILAEPGWDILLLLYGVERSQERLGVIGVCASIDAPQTTAYRWIEKLIEAGLVVRTRHPTDGRVSWLSLSKRGTTQLDRYFDRVMLQESRTLTRGRSPCILFD